MVLINIFHIFCVVVRASVLELNCHTVYTSYVISLCALMRLQIRLKILTRQLSRSLFVVPDYSPVSEISGLHSVEHEGFDLSEYDPV
jgi:hypothetical protein